MELSPDHARRLESLIRPGVVSEVDLGAARCRVTTGGLTTDWLPWITGRAGATRDWNPPTIGEQVLVVSPSGETGAGFVLFGIYSDTHPAPSSSPEEHLWAFPDGARIHYNHASGALEATGIKTAFVQAFDSCTLDTPLTTITGDLVVKGKATIEGLLAFLAGLSGTGSASLNGPLTQSGGALSSNGVEFGIHEHDRVEPGTGRSGGPV